MLFRACCSLGLLAAHETASEDSSPPASDGVWARALDLGGVLNGSSSGVDVGADIRGAGGSLCTGVVAGLTRLYRDMLLEIDSFFGGAGASWGVGGDWWDVAGLKDGAAACLIDRYLENLDIGGGIEVSVSDDIVDFGGALSRKKASPVVVLSSGGCSWCGGCSESEYLRQCPWKSLCLVSRAGDLGGGLGTQGGSVERASEW